MLFSKEALVNGNFKESAILKDIFSQALNVKNN
jgi:hypothetical protein